MKFKNDFLNLYLECVENTESPRIFHIWASLVGISACLGRRCFLDFGVSHLYPNMYVCLVGPPGSRKSTAMQIMAKRIRNTTKVRFAQDDTGGQRQGLIAAMENRLDDEKSEEEQRFENAILSNAPNTLENIANFNMDNIIDPRDAHVVFIAASEFNTFIGHNSIDMLTFLAKMWDGEDYDYRLKKEQLVLKNPLLSLIGCTTSTNIATAMPVEAIGQGFMSRLILVHSNEKYKKVPRPQPLPEALLLEIEKTYNYINHRMEGEFVESKPAQRILDEVYDEEIKINDTRFIYYIERRHVHLIKLCMVLAAARLSKTIELHDVEEALRILRATEVGMPDALGEYGLSPLAFAKQKLVEFIIAAKQAVSPAVLWAVMQRDMKLVDFHNSLADLCNAKKIMKVQTATGEAYAAVQKDQKVINELMQDLIEAEEADDTNIIPFKEVN